MNAVAETPRLSRSDTGRGATSILAAKLVPPVLPAGFVHRARLDDLVERGTERLVTLVSAHPGTGKTVLLSSWFASAAQHRRIAWLALDRDDNRSDRFWVGIERALANADPVGLAADEGDAGPARARARLAGRLDAYEEPLVLVLDDFHQIESPIVLRELQALLDYAPDQLRLVLATRADPQLRLQRLRLTADLTEIRAADLAFTLDECRALLSGHGDGLSDDDVETLRKRTEGWAAGLRFAALSLATEPDQRRYVRRFAGDDRAVADYLLNEILDRQTEQRREFLLRTSVPDLLTAELADELTGRRDGGRVLGELEAASLVVASRAGSGVLYRYHGLLLEFLRAQLRRDRPHDLALLHRVSARWHWEHREPIPAFRDALAGGDWDLADQISGQAWHVVLLAAPEEALAALPDAALVGRPRLCLQAALAALAAGDRVEAELHLEAARALPAADGSHALRLQVEAALARLDGDFELRARLGSELLESPVGEGFGAAARARAQRALALSHLGAAEVALGDLATAEAHLVVALDLAKRAGVHVVVLDVLSELALLETSRGHLRRAVELALEAGELAELSGWSGRTPAIGAHVVLGWAHYQWDDLAASGAHLDRASAAAAAGDRTGRIAAGMLSSLVLAAGGGAREATAALSRLRGATADLDGWRPHRLFAPLVETAEARLLVARGDADGARQALERRAVSNGDSGAGALVRARLLLADGRPSEALAMLKSAAATETAQLEVQLESGVLTAVAYHALRDDEAAGEALEGMLALAGPNSYRRAFLDGGTAVRALLVQRIRRGTAHRSFVAELLAAFDQRAPRVETTRAELLQPLSERETAVLGYLPTMMSNVEIAGELFVTSNTVKTHLKSIYRKLGVSRRRDAVERARGLQLL